MWLGGGTAKRVWASCVQLLWITQLILPSEKVAQQIV